MASGVIAALMPAEPHGHLRHIIFHGRERNAIRLAGSHAVDIGDVDHQHIVLRKCAVVPSQFLAGLLGEVECRIVLVFGAVYIGGRQRLGGRRVQDEFACLREFACRP